MKSRLWLILFLAVGCSKHTQVSEPKTESPVTLAALAARLDKERFFEGTVEGTKHYFLATKIEEVPVAVSGKKVEGVKPCTGKPILPETEAKFITDGFEINCN